MERNEVSIHEVRVYLVLKESGGWMTNKEVAGKAQVAQRTARAHTFKLVKLGILDLAEVFPAHKFKLASHASKRNTAYLQRLDKAREVFGI